MIGRVLATVDALCTEEVFTSIMGYCENSRDLSKCIEEKDLFSSWLTINFLSNIVQNRDIYLIFRIIWTQ
jgi:hypothetical protein